ncbi:hypothetical protein ACLB2K_071725 [Fragaria x ananassa]
MLDVANNMLQGPCRALLADMSGSDNKNMSTAMAWFSFFMAVGNMLGYAAESFKGRDTDIYCANLKSCFFIAIALLALLTVLAMVFVREDTIEDHREEEKAGDGGGVPFLREIKGAFKELKKLMWILLLVTCLNWIAWFRFLLFDTDWMGKEVYGDAVCQLIMGHMKAASKLASGCMSNSLTELLVLKKFGLLCRPRRAPRITEDFHESFLGAFTSNLEIPNSVDAEVMAVIQAIELTWVRDWKHIWLKVDSTIVLNFLRDLHFVPWRLRVAWGNCLHRISQMNFRSSHIFREGNQVADALVNMSFSMSELSWWDEPPHFIRAMYQRDKFGFPNFRFH